MHGFGWKVIGFIALPFVVAIIHIEYVGLLFAASMIAALGLGWGLGVESALSYFAVAWKIYAVLALFTLGFLITLQFQHCCVGLQRFRSHLKHVGWRGIGEVVAVAAAWPVGWFLVARMLQGFGMLLADALVNAAMYWIVDRRRGVRMSSFDTQTGEEQVAYVKTPDDAAKKIVEFVGDQPKR